MDNKLRVRNGYMIFFDGVRVDHIVQSFNTSHANNGGMPVASIRLGLSFGADMTAEDYDRDYRTARDHVILMQKIFKEGTKVLIAIKNVVSGKYVFVFNGSIRGLVREGSKKKRFVSLNVSAIGSISSANKLESILSLPIQTQINDNASVEAFKLKARGLDISNARTMETLKSLKMNEMTITQIRDKTKEALMATNKLYRDSTSTQNFEAIIDRIKILSDIDERLIRSDLLDLNVDISVLKVETIYTTMAKALARVMFEFYELPYGDVLVKAPFWNTPILRDHIIPGIFIADETDSMNFDQRITRSLVSGGLSQAFVGRSVDALNFQFAVPMALYVEDLNGKGSWADIRNVALSGNDGSVSFTNNDLDNLWKDVNGQMLFTGQQTGNAYLDSMLAAGMMVSYNLNGAVKYIEYANRNFSVDAYHIGWRAEVVATQANPLKEFGPAYAPRRGYAQYDKDKSTVVVKFVEGPYKDFKVFYTGVLYLDTNLKIGEIIKDGTKLGRCARIPSDSQLSNYQITVMYPDYEEAIGNQERTAFLSVSPIAVFRDFYAQRESPTVAGVKLTNVETLSNPVDSEYLYGMKYNEENQPIIRFLTTTNDADVIEILKYYTAYGLKARNANVSTMSMSMAIPMPWILPGFNVWVEPEGLDQIYYVNSVSHYGSDGGNCGTSLFLTMGRDANSFFTGNYDGDDSNDFGTLMAGGTFGANVFLSTDKGAKAFFNARDTIDSFSEANHYQALRTKALKFKFNGAQEYNVTDDAFLKYLYGESKKVNVIASNPSKMSDLNLSGEYTEEHIEKVISNLFSSGTKSGVIKARHKDIQGFIASLDPIKTF